MKSNFTALVRTLAFLALIAGMVACSKENILQEANDPGLQAMNSNHPKFKDNVLGSACMQGHTGTAFMVTTSTRNKLNWTLGSLSPLANYNFYGVPVVYALYKKVGAVSGYDQMERVHTFSSLSTNMVYAGSLANLPNNTVCALFVDEAAPTSYPTYLYRPTGSGYCWFYLTASTSSPYSDNSVTDVWCFTTANGAGLPCPPMEK